MTVKEKKRKNYGPFQSGTAGDMIVMHVVVSMLAVIDKMLLPTIQDNLNVCYFVDFEKKTKKQTTDMLSLGLLNFLSAFMHVSGTSKQYVPHLIWCMCILAHVSSCLTMGHLLLIPSSSEIFVVTT